VVLKGFVDDSGSSDGNIFTLAGFLSTAKLWEEFSDEWHDICNREPKTPNFKMTKAMRLKEYRYTQTQRDTRIQELTALTTRKAMYRIGAVVARPNYERIVKGQIPPEIDSIYFVLFFTVILAAFRLMDIEKLEGTVDFVFDNQGKTIEAECIRWYQWIKSHPQFSSNVKRRFGSTPIFRDDDVVLPLKAADMCAWHIRRHLNEEQPKNIPAGEYLETIAKMFGANCLLRPEDLASLVYSIKSGLMFQAHCEFFTPRNEKDRERIPEWKGYWTIFEQG
jgi:hypothetical protein